MPRQRTLNGVITSVRRKTLNTASGNPQYRVEMANGALFVTKPDAAVAYTISNAEWQRGEVVLLLEGNQIYGIRRPEPPVPAPRPGTKSHDPMDA